MLNDKVYEFLKWTGLIALPAVAWFISRIAPVWGIEHAEANLTTLNASGKLIGVLIGVSTIDYRKGAGNGAGGAE